MQWFTVLLIEYTSAQYGPMSARVLFPTYKQCEQAMEIHEPLYETYQDAAVYCQRIKLSKSIRPKLRPEESTHGF